MYVQSCCVGSVKNLLSCSGTPSKGLSSVRHSGPVQTIPELKAVCVSFIIGTTTSTEAALANWVLKLSMNLENPKFNFRINVQKRQEKSVRQSKGGELD